MVYTSNPSTWEAEAKQDSEFDAKLDYIEGDSINGIQTKLAKLRVNFYFNQMIHVTIIHYLLQ